LLFQRRHKGDSIYSNKAIKSGILQFLYKYYLIKKPIFFVFKSFLIPFDEGPARFGYVLVAVEVGAAAVTAELPPENHPG